MVKAGVVDQRGRNADRASRSELARRVTEHLGRDEPVSTSTITAMINGTRKTEREIVDAVAAILGTDDVYDWVDRPKRDGPVVTIPDKFGLLSPRQQVAVVELINSMAEERDGSGDAAPKTQGPSGPAPTAGAKPVRNIRAWQGETPPPIDELEERRRLAEAATDEAMKHPEQHAAQVMPEGGTEYQKQVRAQDEAAEAPEDGRPEG